MTASDPPNDFQPVEPGGRHSRPYLKAKAVFGRFRDNTRQYFAVLRDRSLSRKQRARHAAKGLVVLFGGMGLLLLLYSLLLIPFTPGISELRKAKVERPSSILSADGVKLVEFKPVNREWADLEDIAPEIPQALIATEDHRFYSHPGVDVWRTLGAIYYTLTGNTQGGSTITQQLARNLYPDEIGRDVNLTRKIKEAITAFKIEAVYTKDEILETYLNTVPFLFNAYGIEMAARTYFDKSASELDLLESATLVGMLKGTYYYNPVRRPDRARERRNVVLMQMVKRGHLEEERFQGLKDEPLGLDFERQPGEESKAPHFTEHVRAWLVDWADRNGYNIYRDSLIVHTTLDMGLQQMAEQSVSRWMPGLQAVADAEWSQENVRVISRSPDGYRYYRRGSSFDYFWDSRPELVNAFIRTTPQYSGGIENGLTEEQMLDSLRADETFMEALRQVKTRLEVGMVAMDPATGHIKAWVGSRDYEEDQYDHVARARRQPGSTFKPFVYAAALDEGYRPDDTFPDKEIEIELRNGEVWRPVNAGGYSGQDVTLADGLAYSKNTITAQLIQEVGPRDVSRLARRMGVRRSTLENVPSLALGTSSVTLLEMVNAYSTLAAGGVYRSPVLVTRIEDREGNVIAEFEPEPQRVLDDETAWSVVDMMRGVIDKGTGRRVRNTFGIRADVAGKTGTTQDNADGWFIMMNPELVTGAWVGFNDPRVAFRSDYWGQGANNALYIVGDFFQKAIRQSDIPISKAEFPPSGYEAPPGTFMERVGGWIGDAAGFVGSAIGSVVDAFTDIFTGDEDEEDMGAPPDERQVETLPSPGEYEEVPEDFDQAEADSLNRLERESTQLNRLLERMRDQEEPDDAGPQEEGEGNTSNGNGPPENVPGNGDENGRNGQGPDGGNPGRGQGQGGGAQGRGNGPPGA